ncbi:MAG TPA: phytoene desaturase family protein, partial [Chitinophagaceae bacterium]|nr:phytoene desaturase family protein [Chitinophagaceae bacterium]
MKHVAVIGSGFAGLSAAAYLAKAGFSVDVYDKNDTAGGRARNYSTQGYLFDMGPSWYWMPDIFERFFNDFNSTPGNFYQLVKLDPGFSMVFDDDVVLDVPENVDELAAKLELIEEGSADKLRSFLHQAAEKYRVGMGSMVYKPTIGLRDVVSSGLIGAFIKMQVLTPLSSHVKKYFKHPAIRTLMEFPVLFLGAMPQDTPALYSLMNHAALQVGTWYPMGGFGAVVQAFASIAHNSGVRFYMDTPVTGIAAANELVNGIYTKKGYKQYDAVVAAADYVHVEQHLLPAAYRTHTPAYWQSRTFAPSALIFYLGVRKKISRLQHHTLFFDEDLHQHGHDIYKQPRWPAKPLFYVCCTSKTDEKVAPPGHENMFVLMPVAAGLQDTIALRQKYFDIIMQRVEKFTGEHVRNFIDYKRSYCINDFAADYNSYKGNAYGLANTLRQTANFKPALQSSKLKNLVYAGQLTVPGPGVPPAIISGKIAAHQLIKYF